ncbi:prepilin peptidase [Pasteurellaceae bacterium HPA106]|uniref:prepilin peptidase n=1 Tax=Spirabiliibacterium pneumoniae TaxID=221400 RepID=UPI001AACCBFD|nr:A24 family peptidase [Spirabiliibacterium pneumoniae]MBE2896773.1 prepilin peptidase [Spirabiliibacterium pneumoniae]
MILTALLLGALAGVALQHALQRFPEHINRLLQAECEMLDAHFSLPSAQHLAPFPSCARRLYATLGAMASVLCWWKSASLLAYGLNVAMLWLLLHIALTDWRYHLLSSLNCVLLALIGLLKVRFGLGLTPAQLCESVLFAMLLSLVIADVSRWIYQRCVFGEGDCYLLCAQACFLPSVCLPHVLLWASVLTLAVVAISVLCKRPCPSVLPFAPGLVVSFGLVLLY